MRNRAKTLVTRFMNVGTPSVLMGALWLYLWVFPWYQAYLNDPHWGHNFAVSLAFLAVGLSYFNRRLISDILALVASLLVLPASLELLPHPATAIVGGVLGGLIIVDMIVERGREKDLGQPANKRLHFWLKKHLARFSYTMLGHLALIYFLVRLPGGTYETELVTQVYDALLIPFVILALLEDPVQKLWGVPTAYIGFFWGLLSTLISLVLLRYQPETWICMAITLVVLVVGIAALVLAREPAGQTREA